MNLAEFADRVTTIDVAIAVVIAFVVWFGVNYIGLIAISRYFKNRDTDPGARMKYASLEAGVRLLATLSGVVAGIVSVVLAAI